MSNQWLIINQLDEQLAEWQRLKLSFGKPRNGWVRTIRQALCMSVEQFAERMQLSRGRANQLEIAETHDAITLRALKKAADALDCELVYAIVPKGKRSLKDIIQQRARDIANDRVTSVAHTMSLEAQSIDKKSLTSQRAELAKHLIEKLDKKLWASTKKKK